MTVEITKLVKGFYEIVNGGGEFGDVLSDNFQFGIMAGFPFGGNQDGLEASKSFFEKLGPLLQEALKFTRKNSCRLMTLTLWSRDSIAPRAAATGKEVDLETVHFWTSNGQKLTHYKHYCDTGLLCDALGHNVPK